MIPDVSEILTMLLTGKCNREQAEAWINCHIEMASSNVTINLPALDRLVDVLKENV